MPLYQYTARNTEGELVRETLAFRDEVALRHHLRKSSLYVLEVAERKGSARRGLRKKVRLGDLIVMCRQLRTMINAGMPLVTGLEALADQASNPGLAEVLTDVSRSVGTGKTLAASMGAYPTVFPELLLMLVEAGEDGGRLPESLSEASRQLELQMEVRQKLISALIYPVFTLFATVGTVAAMLIWIVPVFKDIYDDLNATLPPLTLSLVWLSDVIRTYTWIVLLILASLFVALQRYNKTPEGRLMIDTVKLKAPIFGQLFRKTGSANMTGSLAGLLDSGIPLLKALNTAANVTGNELMAQGIRRAARHVSTGRRLSDELEATEQFPVMVVRMIAIAEEVGTLPEVLRQISAGYIEEVEYTIRRIMTIIEPILILCVGGIVGFVLVALYWPIFNIGNVFLEGA